MMREMSSSVTKIDAVNGAYALLELGRSVKFRNASALKNIVLYPGVHYDVQFRPSRQKATTANSTLLDAEYVGTSSSSVHAVFKLWNGKERRLLFSQIAVLTRCTMPDHDEAAREAVLDKHRRIMEARRNERAILRMSDEELLES